MLPKHVLVREVSKNTGFRQADVTKVMDAYVEALRKYAQLGETIVLRNLLTIKPKLFKETTAYDLKTRQRVTVPRRYKIKADMSDKLKLAEGFSME